MLSRIQMIIKEVKKKQSKHKVNGMLNIMYKKKFV